MEISMGHLHQHEDLGPPILGVVVFVPLYTHMSVAILDKRTYGVSGHVYEHVHRHMCTHVHRHVCRHVPKACYRHVP